MDFAAYQQGAHRTVAYPEAARITYPALGLAGEAGEVANQVKKIIRDDAGQLTPERKARILDELGDVLWYAAALASDLGASLDEVAGANLKKLAMRAENGTIQGDKRE
jgi:NTP pyrophosphatase (non-canonical NTP hydrolase)